MMRLFTIAMAAIALVFAASVDRSRRDIDRVFVVTLDRARADHLSVLGYPRPNVSFFVQLAEEGFLFERAYSGSPDLRLAAADLSIVKAGPRPALFDQLSRHGYETATFTNDGELAAGFDAEVRVSSEPKMAAQAAAAWINDPARRKRVAVWLHLSGASLGPESPLDNLAPMGPHFRAYLAEKQGFPADENGRAVGPLERVRAHDARLTKLDFILWRFYKTTLDRKKPTVWLFTALAGEALDAPDDGLRLDEGMIRVPFIVWFSDDRNPGKRYTGLVRHLDAAPSLVELTLPWPRRWLAGMEGRSFSAALRKKGDWSGTATAHVARESGSRAIVAGSLKYVVSGVGSALYDLRTDPLERHDLSPARPKLSARMARRLDWFERRERRKRALAG